MHLFSILGTYFSTSANYANDTEAATVQEEEENEHKWILFRGQEKLGRKDGWKARIRKEMLTKSH